MVWKAKEQALSNNRIICVRYLDVQREQEKELSRIIPFLILQMLGYRV